MPEEPTSPDLVALVRQAFDAASNHDLDALMGFFAPDAVWDTDNAGLGRFDGTAAISSFIEVYLGPRDLSLSPKDDPPSLLFDVDSAVRQAPRVAAERLAEEGP
jgi:hypothetical protein